MIDHTQDNDAPCVRFEKLVSALQVDGSVESDSDLNHADWLFYAEHQLTCPHHSPEAQLRAIGIDTTILRDGDAALGLPSRDEMIEAALRRIHADDREPAVPDDASNSTTAAAMTPLAAAVTRLAEHSTSHAPPPRPRPRLNRPVLSIIGRAALITASLGLGLFLLHIRHTVRDVSEASNADVHGVGGMNVPPPRVVRGGIANTGVAHSEGISVSVTPQESPGDGANGSGYAMNARNRLKLQRWGQALEDQPSVDPLERQCFCAQVPPTVTAPVCAGLDRARDSETLRDPRCLDLMKQHELR